MPRSWTIASIGEALWAESPSGDRPSGLACDVALAAVMQGQRGLPVSRIGQDSLGHRLTESLRTASVATTHIQTDPDLPTPRMLIRSIQGVQTTRIDARAAFDNLQWDFDLEDLAQQADAVVYGLLARRNGQARSTIDRFLTSCPHALRVLDLANRPDEVIDRSILMRAVEFAHGLVLGPHCSDLVSPAWRQQSLDVKVAMMAKECRARFVFAADADGNVALIDERKSAQNHIASDAFAHPLARAHAVMACVRGALSGEPVESTLERVAKITSFVVAHPGEPLPPEPDSGASSHASVP